MDIDTFWKNVDIRQTDECWFWLRAIGNNGYGKVYINEKNDYAHRVAYADKKGPIAKGLVIDHLCRNRACCNPAHLEQVSQRINILRGNGAAAIHGVKTSCVKGHPYNEQNTYTRPDGNGRGCRTCRIESNKKSNAKKKIKK